MQLSPRRRHLALGVAAFACVGIGAGIALALAPGTPVPRRPVRTAARDEPAANVPRPTAPKPAPPRQPPLHRMVGQMVMAGMDGTTPDPALLRRVRAGEIGGIILYADNVGPDLPQAIRALQDAARAGGNPPLLISVDQEGGQIRRFPDGPPTIAPPDLNDARSANAQGQATGRYLRQQGVNVDLAPVSDVPSQDSFLIGQGRGFRGSPAEVAALAAAFAHGLQSAGVAACAKHFPGVGALTTDTDFALQQVASTGTALQAALVPFQAEIRDGIDMVMVASAVYPGYDASGPAGFSHVVLSGLLRRHLGFGGVVITDALDSPDALPGGIGDRAVYAARAGADVILYRPSEDGPAAYLALLHAARSGALTRERIATSYERIVALKQKVATDQSFAR